MQNYLIYLSFENENYYTYIEADSPYLAVTKVTSNFTKSVQKITIYKELADGNFQLLDN